MKRGIFASFGFEPLERDSTGGSSPEELKEIVKQRHKYYKGSMQGVCGDLHFYGVNKIHYSELLYEDDIPAQMKAFAEAMKNDYSQYYAVSLTTFVNEDGELYKKTWFVNTEENEAYYLSNKMSDTGLGMKMPDIVINEKDVSPYDRLIYSVMGPFVDALC